jgi:hypothetical protein
MITISHDSAQAPPRIIFSGALPPPFSLSSSTARDRSPPPALRPPVPRASVCPTHRHTSSPALLAHSPTPALVTRQPPAALTVSIAASPHHHMTGPAVEPITALNDLLNSEFAVIVPPPPTLKRYPCR